MLEKLKNKFKKIEEIEDSELNEYLKNFECNNCHNHCKLNNIKCGGGKKIQEEKINEFKNL